MTEDKRRFQLEAKILNFENFIFYAVIQVHHITTRNVERQSVISLTKQHLLISKGVFIHKRTFSL